MDLMKPSFYFCLQTKYQRYVSPQDIQDMIEVEVKDKSAPNRSSHPDETSATVCINDGLMININHNERVSDSTLISADPIYHHDRFEIPNMKIMDYDDSATLYTEFSGDRQILPAPPILKMQRNDMRDWIPIGSVSI